jgi:hypothetical protein
MTELSKISRDRTAFLETLVAELTVAAYGVSLKRGVGTDWIGLELELWDSLKQIVADRFQAIVPVLLTGPVAELQLQAVRAADSPTTDPG